MMSAPLKKILIVDDDIAMRRLIEVCLRTLPAAQIAVSEGRQALEVLRRERIDLVVTDLVMPGTNGFELVSTMRLDPFLQPIPVVLLSSQGDPCLPEQAKAAGVQAFLMKPFSPSELIGKARELLAR
jgi:CheY-like chemotaxis protein